MIRLEQKPGYESANLVLHRMGQAENYRRWADSPRGRDYRNRRDRVHRENVQQKMRAIKLERGCVKCNYREHHAALEFHHRDPKTKKFRLSESRNYSWDMVEAEIAKCDVMCSNCHHIHEFEQRTSCSQ